MRFLAWHLGLGDSIAFAELAVTIANGEELTVPCWARNEVSVNSIFVHYPNINVRVVESDHEVQTLARDPKAICLGHYSKIHRKEGEDSIQWVYRTAGEDVSQRFDRKVIPLACAEVYQINNVERLPVIHEDKARGFPIDRRLLKGVMHVKVRDEGTSILSWAKVLTKAYEVHCIDSAILHLCEQLETPADLFYHKYARLGSLDYHFRHKWTVLQ